MTASPPPLQILVVDDDLTIRKTMKVCLEAEGHSVIVVGDSTDACSEGTRHAFDLAFVDLRLGAESGLDLIPKLLGESPWLKVVMITAHATINTAVESIRRGAYDYLTKPFTPAQVVASAHRIATLRSLEYRLTTLQDQLARKGVDAQLDTASPAMQRTLELARQVAPTDASILLRGENGTGKGHLARAIHAWSKRSGHAMSVISCPSLSAELLESELFGHVKGAFTGAVRDHAGRIAMSNGGTLFLDEIGDLPIAIQPKLLRVLQDRAYERVGETTTRTADVRIIAATNVDLEAAVRGGRFREDLLYRLNVIQITLPALRDRNADILPLATGMLATLRGAKPIIGFTPAAELALLRYSWPGNVRELRNVVERATILCSTDYIDVTHIPGEYLSIATAPALGDLVTVDSIEEQHIRRVLAKVPSLEAAARILGMDYATLWRRRKKYGLT